MAADAVKAGQKAGVRCCLSGWRLKVFGPKGRAVGESIFTEADSLDELRANVRSAVECHFDEGQDVTAPNHAAPRAGTLNGILKDVAEHAGLSRDDVVKQLFDKSDVSAPTS